MSDSVSYGKRGYLAFKKETTAGTAVAPDVFAEFLETTLPYPWNLSKTNTVQGNRSINTRSYAGAHKAAELEISLPAEPFISGHLLNGLFGDETVTTVASSLSYHHDYQPRNTQDSYTMDFAVAGEDYVTRYFGCRFSKLALSINDNRADWKVSVMAQRWFTNARVTVTVSSGTTLTVDQTTGLTTSDTIQVLSSTAVDTVLATLTIAAVVSETVLTTSTIGVSLPADSIIVIKRNASPVYTSMGTEFIWAGGASVAIGTSANPVDNTTAAVDMTKFSCEFTNNLEAENAATGNNKIDLMPSRINLNGFDVSDFSLSHVHANPDFIDALRSRDQLGVRVKFLGTALDTNALVASTLTIESDSADTVVVTVDATGEAGNDWNLTIVSGGASLTATLSGKNITLTLDAVAANNTVTLVASAIHALTGVASTSTGTGLVTTADNLEAVSPLKKNFAAGRDASEKNMLRIDLPNAKLMPIELPMNDGLITEELKFTADHNRADQTTGNLSSMTKVRLRNATTAY